MRWQVRVALLKATVGGALTTKVVALLMLLMTVLEAKVPVPELTTTGMPNRRLAVLLTVTVVPLLLAPVNTGLLTPTLNFTNTQAASQLLGPVLARQLFSQLRSNSTSVKLAALFTPAEVFWPVVVTLLTAMLLANSAELRPAAQRAKMK